MMYVTLLNDETSWWIGFDQPVNFKPEQVVMIQADGDELTFSLKALDLPEDDHNPRVQTFVGPAARKIATALV